LRLNSAAKICVAALPISAEAKLTGFEDGASQAVVRVGATRERERARRSGLTRVSPRDGREI
jgi:hypothetical protein